MASLKNDIQGAVITLLLTDTSVAALVATRIYEEPTDNTASPYIIVGDMREERELTMNSSQTSGTNIATVYLPLLACYEPTPTAAAPKSYYKAARDVAAACEAALHKVTLTLSSSGWTAILCVKDSEQERRGEEGQRVVEQTYKIIAYKDDVPPTP